MSVRTRAGKCLRTASVSVWKICQRNILGLWGALEILMEWSTALECKPLTESLEMPRTLEKAGMFSSVFLIRMARCSQERLCHVCPLPEDVSFCLSWANSMDLSQTQSRAVGRGGGCSWAEDRVVLTRSTRSVLQHEVETLSTAPCMRLWLCSSLALEMCTCAMPFASSNHRNPTVPWTGPSTRSSHVFECFGGFFYDLNAKTF